MQKKAVKNIIKKALLLVLPIYLLWFLYIEFMPMYYNSANNTRWYFIKKSLEKEYVIPQSKILFLGESRVNAGLDFTKIPNSYSFASGGATPLEMFYILGKYLEEYQKPDTVYLSISPRFLSETFAFHPYVLRNNLLTYSNMSEICKNLKSTENDTTLGSFTRLKFFLNKLNYLEYYQTDVLKSHVLGSYDENVELINEMIDMKGGRVHPNLKDSCSLLNYETKYKHFVPSPLLTNYFNKILILCKEEDIVLNFFFMPMNESSYNNLKPAFVKEYKSFIKTYKKHYPKFNISDSVYSYSDNYFGDASHLNLKGKELFTKQFLKEYSLQ